MWLAESSGSLLGAMSTDMMQFDMQELLPADKDSKTKNHGVKNLLNVRFTFRLWQILFFLLVMTIIITVTCILAAKFDPASPCYKISTKEDRGNLTFLLLRLFVGLQLAFLETVQAVSFSKVYLFVSLCCL